MAEFGVAAGIVAIGVCFCWLAFEIGYAMGANKGK
jgi:hypothetical protein